MCVCLGRRLPDGRSTVSKGTQRVGSALLRDAKKFVLCTFVTHVSLVTFFVDTKNMDFIKQVDGKQFSQWLQTVRLASTTIHSNKTVLALLYQY